MKKEYSTPNVDIKYFDEYLILTASVVVGDTNMPGDEVIGGTDLFG